MAQPLADLESCHAGQHQIEDIEIGRALQGLLQRLWAGVRHIDTIAFIGQRASPRLGDAAVIIDD